MGPFSINTEFATIVGSAIATLFIKWIWDRWQGGKRFVTLEGCSTNKANCPALSAIIEQGKQMIRNGVTTDNRIIEIIRTEKDGTEKRETVEGKITIRIDKLEGDVGYLRGQHEVKKRAGASAPPLVTLAALGNNPPDAERPPAPFEFAVPIEFDVRNRAHSFLQYILSTSRPR